MIKLIITDAGPLISLAKANALDLLLEFADGVEVAMTDLVYHEVTSARDVYLDAEKIFQFISKNSGRIVVQDTVYGQLILKEIRSNPDFAIPDDAGEMSIMSLNINRSEPSVILFEDLWFVDRYERLSKNTHIVSTCAFVNTAYTKNIISSARYNEIMCVLKLKERNMDIIETNTEWEDSFSNRVN